MAVFLHPGFPVAPEAIQHLVELRLYDDIPRLVNESPFAFYLHLGQSPEEPPRFIESRLYDPILPLVDESPLAVYLHGGQSFAEYTRFIESRLYDPIPPHVDEAPFVAKVPVPRPSVGYHHGR